MRRIRIETALSPDECRQRIADRGNLAVSSNVSVQLNGDRMTCRHSPETPAHWPRALGQLRDLARTFAPVVFDGRLESTARGTAIEGRFRMGRDAWVTMVGGVAVLALLESFGLGRNARRPAPSLLFAGVAALVLAAIVRLIAILFDFGGLERTQIVAVLLRDLEAEIR